ncbi:MAG: hypothetical protein HY827_00015 [Actinobacteria bacterium]|nr:hypothetical protein [Actinomycetota bacterium]
MSETVGSKATTTMLPSNVGDRGRGGRDSRNGGDARPVGRMVNAPIPERLHPNGPVTRARLRRTFFGVACAWAIGAIPLAIGASAGWKAFGLGLFLPGGGFVYTSDPVFAAASLIAFALALVLYWAFGPVLLPPAVWVGAATLSTLRIDTGLWDTAQVAVPVALVVVIAGSVTARQIVFRRARRRGRALNERLRDISFPVSSAPAAPPVGESSPEDLSALRYAFDLALQPIDRWDGFGFVDQFREAAVRYQLNFLQYSTAMSQYTCTPAFTGYLAEAQRNAIEKMLQPRVWKYWRWENLWGNLRWEPDPLRRDNVMLSGYWGTMVGLYESLNGDDRYNAPGALTFRNGEREVYPYDFGTVAGLMRANLLRSPFCMFPCEPSWIYPICSSYALNTVILHDRLNGGDSSDVMGGFRESFDRDFLHPDGRIVAIRNGRLGFAIGAAPTINESVLVSWLNPGLPDFAQRLWWLLRERVIDLDGPKVLPTIRDLDRVDVGNYHFGKDTFARTMVLLAAREMGDDEVAEAVQCSIDQTAQIELQRGVRRYRGLSVYGNLAHTLARFMRRDATRDMIAFDLPAAWTVGPRLSGAAYPDVLVARAVTDGRALDLVLRPGAGPVRTTLALDRLVPGAKYAVDGHTAQPIVADARGSATITDVELGDRLELRVRPL